MKPSTEKRLYKVNITLLVLPIFLVILLGVSMFKTSTKQIFVEPHSLRAHGILLYIETDGKVTVFEPAEE